MNLFDIDSQQLQTALNGGMTASDLGALIKNIESKLDSLIPMANHVFANIVTEAFDASGQLHGLRADSMVSLMDESSRVVSGMLFDSPVGVAAAAPVLAFEMLFSSPESVPFIVRISAGSGASRFNDCDLQMGHAGISTSSDLFADSAFGSARLDA